MPRFLKSDKYEKFDMQRLCAQAQKANGPPPAFVRAGPSGVK